MAERSLFEGVNGPAAQSSDGSDYTVGVEFRVTEPGCTLTKIRFWYSGSEGATFTAADHVARLYAVGNPTPVATATFPLPLTTGWNVATLATPYDLIEDAQAYLACVYFTTNNGYTATAPYWIGIGPGFEGIVNGALSAPSASSAAGAGQGTFRADADAIPNSQFNSANYWVDPVIEDGIAAPEPTWLHRTGGVSARNGTSTHTINFATDGDAPFTPTDGNMLVVVAVSGSAIGWSAGWTERLSPTGASELSVATVTAASTTGATLTLVGSDLPVVWAAFEFPAGTTWVNGASASGQANTAAQPTVTGLPGTPVTVLYAVGKNMGTPNVPTPFATWPVGAGEAVDRFTPGNGTTDGAWLSIGYQTGVTATTATVTPNCYGLGAGNTERATFALNVPSGAPGSPTVVAGQDRPVVNGQGVALDVAATPAAPATITGYSWAITSGGGSLTGATTATPTYTAPGSGIGTATIECTATESDGGTASDALIVGYGPNIVAAENQLAGTARATWDLANPNFAGVATLQGFADGFTADRGNTVSFKIAQSDTDGWTGQVYRLGYYGGNGARLIDELTPTSGQLTDSQSQPAPGDSDAGTTLLSADCSNWAVTLAWDPPAWAPSGIYILRLERTSGGASHVMFILRDDARVADLMLMPADSTWQAYNAFGGMGANLLTGNSLYYGTAVDQYNADCARYVSYNRPVVNRAACNTGQAYGGVEWSTFFTSEYPMVRWLERNGYDVKYYSCLDAAGDPIGALLDNVSAAIAVGHNEYWSDGMRSGWETAKASGRSLFFAAANEVFWRMVGTSPDSDGRPRTFECQKSTIGGRGNTRPQWTGTWRDPDGAGKGGDNPEIALTGTIFVVNGADLRALVVPKDGGYADSPLWRNCAAVQALTAGQTWASPSQIIGFEWDTYGPAGFSGTGTAFAGAPPAGAVYASSTTATPAAVLTDAGDQYTSLTVEHRLVIHPSSGAGGITFGTGTVNWPLGLDNANTYQQGSDNTSVTIRQATVNILADMGAQPETLMSGLVPATLELWFDTISAEIAGALPGLAGSLDASISASVVIAGDLPTLGGAISANLIDSAVIGGQLPTLAGSLQAEFSLPTLEAVIGGDLPGLGGALAAYVIAPATLAGNLPGLGGLLTASLISSVLIGGQLPGLSGSLPVDSSLPALQVVIGGNLPTLGGTLSQRVIATARELVWSKITGDPTLQGLGFDEDHVFTDHSLDTPQVRPLIVLRWQNVVVGLGSVNQRILQVWVHDQPADYERIDQTLKRLRTLLGSIEAVRIDGGAAGLHTVIWEGESDDLRDVEVGTITRWAQFRLTGSAF